jgi:hypothetical protein
MTTNPTNAADGESAALARAALVLQRLSSSNPWQESDEDLAETVQELELLARLAAAQSVKYLAEVSARGLPGRAGHAGLSQWLRASSPSVGRGHASTLARRAEALFREPVSAELAPTRQAMLAGELRPEQVDVIVSTVDALTPPDLPADVVDPQTLAEAQAFLLGEAKVFDAAQLRRLATHVRLRLDPGADDRLRKDEDARERARSLSLVTEPSGMVHLVGALTPECGAALSTAIDAWSAPRPAADGTPDLRSAAQRRHDSLQRVARAVVTAPGELPSTHGSPYRVVVTVPHETFAAALGSRTSGSAPARLPDGTALSSLTLAVRSCDAEVVPVLVDEVGNPLDVGDSQYSFPPRQRTAITLRDNGCTYPGCGAPAPWCDVHHIVPASRGGPTSVRNGTLLCGRHHRHVHAAGRSDLPISATLVDGQVVWDVGGADGVQSAALTRADRALVGLTRRWHARRLATD